MGRIARLHCDDTCAEDNVRVWAVELDYIVMTHAQKIMFMYGQNGLVHILLQQI
jgi:hypothetical protein